MLDIEDFLKIDNPIASLTKQQQNKKDAEKQEEEQKRIQQLEQLIKSSKCADIRGRMATYLALAQSSADGAMSQAQAYATAVYTMICAAIIQDDRDSLDFLWLELIHRSEEEVNLAVKLLLGFSRDSVVHFLSNHPEILGKLLMKFTDIGFIDEVIWRYIRGVMSVVNGSPYKLFTDEFEQRIADIESRISALDHMNRDEIKEIISNLRDVEDFIKRTYCRIETFREATCVDRIRMIRCLLEERQRILLRKQEVLTQTPVSASAAATSVPTPPDASYNRSSNFFQ